jgi:ssDNA-binding Zn-finger/Zn-ribbon topoisomerase 1
MHLRNSARYGLFYGCSRYPDCRATHGAHQHSGEPLGYPADAETKALRIKLHRVFDRFWKGPNGMKRKTAYRLLAELMSIPKSVCHIAMFNADQCRKAIKILKDKEEKGL